MLIDGVVVITNSPPQSYGCSWGTPRLVWAAARGASGAAAKGEGYRVRAVAAVASRYHRRSVRRHRDEGGGPSWRVGCWNTAVMVWTGMLAVGGAMLGRVGCATIPRAGAAPRGQAR